MNSLVLLLICVAILVIGYIFYGGWLCKQWGVGAKLRHRLIQWKTVWTMFRQKHRF